MFVSHTNTRQVTHYGSANQEFSHTSVRSTKQKAVLIAGIPNPPSPIPSLFPFLPIPYPSQKFVWCSVNVAINLILE